MALGQPCSSTASDLEAQAWGTVRTLLHPLPQGVLRLCREVDSWMERCGDVRSWDQGRDVKGEGE